MVGHHVGLNVLFHNSKFCGSLIGKIVCKIGLDAMELVSGESLFCGNYCLGNGVFSGFD